jgi:hypothetical protein
MLRLHGRENKNLKIKGVKKMNESHPIKMTREDVYYNSGMVTDLANMFSKGALPIHPAAILRITGTQLVADLLLDRLVHTHGVPKDKIQTIPINNQNFSVNVVIVFSPIFGPPLPPFNNRFKVELKLDGKPLPFELEFETSPDGTMVSGVQVQWDTPLKTVIDDSVRMGVRNLKFATKVKGLAGFDRKTLDTIDRELKLKIYNSLSFYLRSGSQYIKIEFYAAGGIKHGKDDAPPHDYKFKPFGEVGGMVTFPFDVADFFLK